MSRNSQDSPPEERTIYVGNFAEQVDEDMLEELFIQTGPVVKVIVRDIKDSNAKYALIEFEDEATVLYAIELMNGVKVFNKEINVKPRNGTKQEELYRRKRGEIEERMRAIQADLGGGDRERDRRSSYDNRRDYQRDRSPHSRDSGGGRDWDRNLRSNSRNSGSSGGRDSSWQPRHQNRQHNEFQLLPPPPPPPPLMGGGGGNWRSGGGPPSYHTPQMLPHQHFVNMMQQQGHHSAPAYTDSHQNTPRHQQQQQYDRRRGGSDRNAANHYNRNSHGGGGGGRY